MNILNTYLRYQRYLMNVVLGGSCPAGLHRMLSGAAQLAAAGQTNRQIAQALFVTQRTVENHLTSSYGKLGISSRSGLSAAFADSRPPAASKETSG